MCYSAGSAIKGSEREGIAEKGLCLNQDAHPHGQGSDNVRTLNNISNGTAYPACSGVFTTYVSNTEILQAEGLSRHHAVRHLPLVSPGPRSR